MVASWVNIVVGSGEDVFASREHGSNCGVGYEAEKQTSDCQCNIHIYIQMLPLVLQNVFRQLESSDTLSVSLIPS